METSMGMKQLLLHIISFLFPQLLPLGMTRFKEVKCFNDKLIKKANLVIRIQMNQQVTMSTNIMQLREI